LGSKIESNVNPIYSAQKVFAGSFLMILLVEWLSFFIFFVINLKNLKTISIFDIVMITSFVIFPFIGLILNYIGRKHANTLLKLAKIIFPIILILTAISSWVFYTSYYQIGPWFTVDNIDLQSEAAVIALVSNYKPMTSFFLLLTNGLIFFFLVPILLIFISDGKFSIIIDKSSNRAFLLASIYFIFRNGSMMGTPLRLFIICLVMLGLEAVLWFLKSNPLSKNSLTVVNDKNEEVEDNLKEELKKEVKKDLDPIWFSPEKAPFWSGGGITFIITFWIIIPAFSMDGMLGNSWVWVGLLIGSLIVELMEKLNSQFNGVFAVILIYTFAILVILCQIEDSMLHIQPWLLFFGLICLGLLLPALRTFSISQVLYMNYSLEKDQNQKTTEKPKKIRERLLNHPTRQFWWFFMALVGIAVPFLTGITDPYSTWIVLGWFILAFAVNLRTLFKSN
jgi:hypothetical protein